MAMDWRALPSLTGLRAFAATAELRSFTHAARALNVTHAAVAQQVRALEDYFDLALVQRDGRGVSLTAEGEVLADTVLEGFATLQRGADALRRGGADRPVRLTLTASFAAQWLMPRLRDFWERHPDIGLSLHPDSRVIDLHREGMDVAIRYGNGDWPGVEATFLASARLVVAGSPLILGDKTRLSREEMREMDWIIATNWPEQNNYLRSLGLEPSELRQTDFPNEELSIAAAREGLGLFVDSLALVAADVAEGRLRVVHESRDQLPAYFVVTLPGPQRAATRAFLKWLRSQA